jgi:hypothetical protein
VVAGDSANTQTGRAAQAGTEQERADQTERLLSRRPPRPGDGVTALHRGS